MTGAAFFVAMPIAIPHIAHRLGNLARRFDIDALATCASTNAELLARAEAGAASGTVLIAERQTAGRGRRGRTWFSSPGDSLTFSLFWRLAPGTAPGGLSLAAGVAVARALATCGADRCVLKWPNDILLGGRKLGGILVELLPGAPHAAVIGIGINLKLPDGMPADVRAASAAFVDAAPLPPVEELYAALLTQLAHVLDAFAAGGFAALRNDWMARHAHQDTPVRLDSDFAPPRYGLCRGVDEDGALLIEHEGRVERVLSGEISLRGTGAGP